MSVSTMQDKVARVSGDDELVGNLIWGPARPLQGSQLDDHQLVEAVAEVFAGRRVCIVRHWIVIDIKLTDKHEALINRYGVQPTVLYANTVVDPVDAQDRPSGILSDYQIPDGYEDCFFKTEDTLYVLAGRGSQALAEVPTVAALARHCGTTLQGL
nr:hypothetical protein [uncultured Pseudomonas sp.]